ncbi:glycosyltransferase family 61 protein [Microcoleus sp. FACHB-831]|nr:glycosyltransferase family 61 protein [Microcoleus sp. FACHB-831]
MDKFIINTYKFPYQRETLNLLQIPETKLVESLKYHHIKTDTLVVPSLAGRTGNMPKWVCDFLRKEFLLKPGINNSDLPKRIYISRAKAVVVELLMKLR